MKVLLLFITFTFGYYTLVDQCFYEDILNDNVVLSIDYICLGLKGSVNFTLFDEKNNTVLTENRYVWRKMKYVCQSPGTYRLCFTTGDSCKLELKTDKFK